MSDHLAKFYDIIMEDIPYDDFIKVLKKYAKDSDRILDIGCGTGIITCALSTDGYLCDGLDISSDMLVLANERARNANLNIKFFNDNITTINIKNYYNLAFAFFDTINYLTTKEDVETAFQNINKSLKDEGYFIFDVFTPYNLTKVLETPMFNREEDGFVYLWNCFEEDELNTITHQMTFFIEDGKHYKRLDDEYMQKTFEISEYKEMLEAADFEIDLMYSDFDYNKSVNDTSLRVTFVTKKRQR